MSEAPGAPGLPPTWSSSNKDMVSCALGSSRLRWGLDRWQDVREQDTVANPLGLHVVEIDRQPLRAGRRVDLTYRSGSGWVGRDFCVQVVPRTRRSG